MVDDPPGSQVPAPRSSRSPSPAAPTDRAGPRRHMRIGLRMGRAWRGDGIRGDRGGGLGRKPDDRKTIRDSCPKPTFLPYVEAIRQASYNLLGRRDQQVTKARIKLTDPTEHGNRGDPPTCRGAGSQKSGSVTAVPTGSPFRDPRPVRPRQVFKSADTAGLRCARTADPASAVRQPTSRTNRTRATRSSR